MIDVISNVIFSRLSKGEDNTNATIQLSSLLMNKFRKEICGFTGIGTMSPLTNPTSEITIAKYDLIWTIRNREYRDDTNDPDVEEELYKLAQE